VDKVFNKFLNPYSQLSSLIDQYDLEMIDVIDLPITFIDSYYVAAYILGHNDILDNIYAVQIIDRLFLINVPMMSISYDFSIVLNWVLRRFKSSRLDEFSLLDSMKLYAYMKAIEDDSDAFTCYIRAKELLKGYKSFVSINEFEEIAEDHKLLYAIDSLVVEPFSQCNEYVNTGRIYYILLPTEMRRYVGFDLRNWGFIK
jgi:hypothetical protein